MISKCFKNNVTTTSRLKALSKNTKIGQQRWRFRVKYFPQMAGAENEDRLVYRVPRQFRLLNELDRAEKGQ